MTLTDVYLLGNDAASSGVQMRTVWVYLPTLEDEDRVEADRGHV